MQVKRSTAWLAGAALTFVSGSALATPPSGIVSATVVARAAFPDSVDLKLKVNEDGREVVMHAPDTRDTVMQTIVIGPGGNTGWHSHPGPVVVLVKAGELTLYDGDDPACTGRTYSAGQAFIDRGQGHLHLARNLSASQNTEIWVTYFDVPPGAPFRIDAADAGNCS